MPWAIIGSGATLGDLAAMYASTSTPRKKSIVIRIEERHAYKVIKRLSDVIEIILTRGRALKKLFSLRHKNT